MSWRPWIEPASTTRPSPSSGRPSPSSRGTRRRRKAITQPTSRRPGSREDGRATPGRRRFAAAPPDHGAWYGYAEFCLYLGREGIISPLRRDLLAKFGETKFVYVAERAGRACLLRPASGDDLRRAAALAERVGAINRSKCGVPIPSSSSSWVSRSTARGHLDRAISLMRGTHPAVLGPALGLVLSAMALQQGGRSAEARKTLRRGRPGPRLEENQGTRPGRLDLPCLRREAEQMILPCLPAFLECRKPSDNDERLRLPWGFANSRTDASHWPTFTQMPSPQIAQLANFDLGAGHRYAAASRFLSWPVSARARTRVSLARRSGRGWLKQAARLAASSEVAACAVKADGRHSSRASNWSSKLSRLGGKTRTWPGRAWQRSRDFP